MAATCGTQGEPLCIKQGTTRIITLTRLRDAYNNILDPTGWGIHGVARAGMWGPVVAIWRDNPGPTEHLAEVVPADTVLDPTADPTEKWIYLHIDPTDSDAWSWSEADLDVELTEPGTGREEAFTTELRLVPTTIRE